MDRIGSLQNRAKILRSTIPAGGFGRHLTQAECRDLRALGRRCSCRWIVVRQVAGIDYLGIVYYPSSGGFSHAGIYVETR